MTMDDGGSELHEENTKTLEDDGKMSDGEREGSNTVVNYNEDKLLKTIGAKPAINSDSSKRSLFGVPLVGAKAAFKAMDRRGNGRISIKDFVSALLRLDTWITQTSCK